MSYAPPTRTAGQVMNQVKRQFGDESGVQITDDDLLGWINDAQTVIVTKNKILKAKSTAPSIAGQASYTFPSLPIHQIESIHYAGVRIANLPFPTAEEKIFNTDPDRVSSGPPQFWYEWAGTFTFWPTPDAVENIDIYYTAKPAPVASNANLLSVSDKYFQTVVQYVLMQAYELDEDWKASQTKGEQVRAGLAEMGEEERSAQNMTYDVINVLE